MPSFTITPCTINDSPALAHNNMSAFWTDPNWVLVWRGKTLEHVITQAARRMPHNLLTDPTHRRHQKAVDSSSGTAVGYIRWILPEEVDKSSTMLQEKLEDMWPAARVPDVSEERKREAGTEYRAADWHLDHATDELDPPVTAMKNRLRWRKSYLVLDYLAVHPSHKGQGIATLLVQSGIQEADKMGLPIFVLAFKAGLGVYKKLGFKLLDQVIQDDSKYGGTGEWGVYFLEKEVGVGGAE